MKNLLIFKNFILDPILSLLYFPFWWYGDGFLKLFFSLKKKIEENFKNLSLKILFLYLFKPMYGDYSREGRIISFFMRSFHLGWRLLRFFLVIIFYLIFFLFYLFIPIFTLYQIICHLSDSCYYFFIPSII